MQCLTGMEIRKFLTFIFEHPWDCSFRKCRSRTLAPVRFTNPNSIHRDWGCYTTIQKPAFWFKKQFCLKIRVFQMCMSQFTGPDKLSIYLIEICNLQRWFLKPLGRKWNTKKRRCLLVCVDLQAGHDFAYSLLIVSLKHWINSRKTFMFAIITSNHTTWWCLRLVKKIATIKKDHKSVNLWVWGSFWRGQTNGYLPIT